MRFVVTSFIAAAEVRFRNMEHSSQSNGVPDNRRDTRKWDEWLRVSTERNDKPNTRVCLFCGKSTVFVKQRAFAHFGYPHNSPLPRCTRLPRGVLELFRDCGGIVPKNNISYANVVPDSRVDAGIPYAARETTENIDTPRIKSVQVPSSNKGSHGSNGQRISTLSSGRRHGQKSMEDSFDLATRQNLDAKWASFFYEANIAFNVVRHPAFISAVQETAKAGIGGYQPPSYQAIRTTLLDAKKAAVQRSVEDRTKLSIEKYGGTICSDGWSDVTSRPLINMMLVCPVGEVFLGSVDTTGKKKDIAYVANEMAKYIEEVGPQNIVQICTDNASTMLGAVKKLQIDYPHLYGQGCAAHILDLLLEDWGKEAWVKHLVEQAKRVCTFIKGSHVPLALFRKYSPKLQLKVPPQTRFATNYLMIERLLKLQQPLNNMVIDAEWHVFVQTLFNRQNSHQLQTKARNVRNSIRSDEFWENCTKFVKVVEPVLLALREFDGEVPAMPRAYVIMSDLKEHVFSLREPPFELSPDIATKYEDAFQKRWEMMLTDLHYAAALLNPYLTNMGAVQNNGEAKRALNRVIRKLSAPMGVVYEEVVRELIQYEERTGPFNTNSEAPDPAHCDLLPHQWWHQVGGNALPKIAKRILALTCSASSCERNWSMYSFVHNKVRNRLSTSKAEDLVYIYANAKLERQKRTKLPRTWYENCLEEEDSDIEDYVPDNEWDDGVFMDNPEADDDNYVNDGSEHDDLENWNDNEGNMTIHVKDPFEFDDDQDVPQLPRQFAVFASDTEGEGVANLQLQESTCLAKQDLVNRMDEENIGPLKGSPHSNNDDKLENVKGTVTTTGVQMDQIKVEPDDVSNSGCMEVGSPRVSTIRSRNSTLNGHDSDVPLQQLFPRVTQPKGAHTTRMVLPKMEVKIEPTSPTCNRALAVARDVGPSTQPRNRITRGQKRLRKAHDRRCRKGARVHEEVHAGIASSNNLNTRTMRHLPLNANGITNASRPLKRLVTVNKKTTTDTELRNLASEVECEVRNETDDEDEDGDQSTDDSLSETDPNADEVSSDDTYTLNDT